jgi:polyketide biosynthesis 3-hydroxy-3-methylglutaryl-CoA synthase-like enzyme PksG
MTAAAGIEALGVYCGLAQIPVKVLLEERGLDTGRIANLMMDRRSVQLPWEDPVTNAVNAASSVVAEDRDRIELLIVSTESGLDYSKSLATYVHRYLDLPPRCRILEVKQACYGVTAALRLAAGQVGHGTKALVIGTDVNPMDQHAQYAEPTTGHGAVALLVGDDPKLLRLDPGPSGLHCFETMDTARPAPDRDLYNTDLSLLTYLECMVGSVRDYLARNPGTDLSRDFDFLAMHTPFAGMVRAAHRKMMREFAPRPPKAVEEDFRTRLAASLVYPRAAGNLCSSSLYLALAGIIDTAASADARVGLFSYGSGCASEFFSGVIPSGANEILARADIAGQLGRRRELTFAEYERLGGQTRDCLVPKPHRDVDLSGADEEIARREAAGKTLVLRSVHDYLREYEWR